MIDSSFARSFAGHFPTRHGCARVKQSIAVSWQMRITFYFPVLTSANLTKITTWKHKNKVKKKYYCIKDTRF